MEEELINRIRNGDREAVNILIRANYDILKGYVIKLTGNLEESKDIVQETILRAIVNIHKFHPKAKFSTWLITIATNLYRDKLKNDKKYLPFNEELNLYDNNLEVKAIESIRTKEVFSILRELPYEKRTVFILKHYYNYKYEEIAQIMKCPIGTIRSRLHNCIKIILNKMKERGMLDEG